MRTYLAPFATPVASVAAPLALVSVGLFSAACDAPMRVGSGASAGGPAAPETTLLAGDAGTDGGDELIDEDAVIDRSAWVMDPVPGVTVTTLAGGRAPGRADGKGAAAQFYNPVNLVLEASGSLLVSDFDNGMIRRVTAQGDVSTLVPKGTFERPFGITFASTGELFVQTDIDPVGEHNEYTGTIWRVDPASGAAVAVVTDVGRPRGMTPLADGTLALSDLMTQTVRVFDPATSSLSTLAGFDRSASFTDGDGLNARFNEAYGAAALPSGDVLIADRLNHRVRIVSPSGAVSTFAGDGVRGMKDGPKGTARFNSPKDVAVDAAGNVYVADNGNFLIRRIDPQGNVQTLAGEGTPGFADGAGTAAQFYGEEGIAVSPDGKTLYVADGTNGKSDRPYNRIRTVAIP
jgi:sugar lactone lactonase YvrE